MVYAKCIPKFWCITSIKKPDLFQLYMVLSDRFALLKISSGFFYTFQ